ncbi:MAG: type III-A CRISPR-associated RAMP protein Csm3 [Acidobacteriota bacterium]|nr:type III-A CRISPR-associated RAMP protein Csm3 [Blastocatellia bacterium]MDW8238329.1 type III-A CRISPR-associated RAMP protein Csm3 [Acidobacteriota bacterium]
MPNITLKGKVIITGEIEAVTGLHIGGAAAGLDIGGIDNPIIRHPVTREPYIPGSSLRGKMRSLLDRHFGNDVNKFIQRREPVVRVHECETEDAYATCAVCQIFGVTPGDQRRQWTQLKPTRLLVRDVMLAKGHEATERLRRAKTDLPFTEVKWEAVIDRITSAAVPRQNERVPAGAVFAPLELVYSLYDLNGTGCQADIDWLQHVFKAMELLEDDYVGGYGSRGAGKIAFTNVTVTFKSHDYYQGTGTVLMLDQNRKIGELQPSRYAQSIQQAVGGTQ